MIELKNISKIYSSKNKGKVRALNGVNLTFPEKGLCLVVGKSGCGKTTLLNILGGLDLKYEGEFTFLNKKLAAKDFSEYRKNYVSFVFQDFNLIEDLDVGENLSIGYNFAKKSEEGKQEDALKKVGLEDYGYRFPQELSGGEQQRVAIARAMLKDCKVLLADEPTGNLDRENGVEIYKLLKEISLKKLVIVVSHDEQLSREYADYVVRLEDGKVVENNLPDTVCEESYSVSKRKAIRSKIAWQMAWYEFTRKKSRSILTVITLIICLSLVSFASPLLFYNSADPHYALVRQKGYEKVLLNNLTYDTYMGLQEKGIEMTLSNAKGGSENCSLVFQSKEEAEEYGIEFYPCDKELPLSADTYYVSDRYLQQLIMYGNNKALINGEEVSLNLTEYALTDVVGEKLAEFGYEKTCAGVYRYPEQPFDVSDEDAYYNEPYGTYISTELEGEREKFIFIKILFDGKKEFLPNGISVSGLLTGDYILLDENGNVTILDGNSYNDLMQDHGVYLSLSCFNGTFGERYEKEDLIDWRQNEVSEDVYETEYFGKLIPEQLGKEISFEVTDRMTQKVETVDGLTVKGIVIPMTWSSSYRIWFGGREDLLKCNMMVDRFCAWADVSSVKPLRSGMRSISRDFNCGFYTAVTTIAGSFEEFNLNDLQSTVSFVAIAMAVVSVLSVAVLISGQILSRKREVGIFKALGAKSADISLIYVYEMIIITVLVTVFSLALTTLLIMLLNLYISAKFSVLSFAFVYGLLSVGVILALFAIGTLLPLLKLNRLNVIESIRSKAGK